MNIKKIIKYETKGALYSANKKIRHTIQITNERPIHGLNYQRQYTFYLTSGRPE